MPEDQNDQNPTVTNDSAQPMPAGHVTPEASRPSVKQLPLSKLTWSHVHELKARHQRQELRMFAVLGVSVALLGLTLLAYNSSWALGKVKLASVSVPANAGTAQLAS